MSTNNAVNIHYPFGLFSAYYAASTGAVTGDSTLFALAFDTSAFDETSSFSGGVFTAPREGMYYFNCTVLLGGLDATHLSADMSIASASYSATSDIYAIGAMRDSSNQASLSISCILPASAGDTFRSYVTVYSGNKTVFITSGGSADPLSWMCGYCVNY